MDSNDVGNAIAPLAAISYILKTSSVPGDDFSVPLWILILGGAGIVTGLGIWGKNVIATVGEKIISFATQWGILCRISNSNNRINGISFWFAGVHFSCLGWRSYRHWLRAKF